MWSNRNSSRTLRSRCCGLLTRRVKRKPSKTLKAAAQALHVSGRAVLWISIAAAIAAVLIATHGFAASRSRDSRPA